MTMQQLCKVMHAGGYALTGSQCGRILSFRSPSRSKILRRFSTNLVISCGSVLATLFLLEIGIRIVNPQDLSFWDSHQFRRVQSTPPHFVENIPHGHTNFIGVPVAINRDGLRGDEISIPKPPGIIRILAVGDSITFGYGVRVEDTYAKVLERSLNERPPVGMRYEVLNGGTLGGSLGDYLHFLNQKATALNPDVVLLGLTLNDILVYSKLGSVSETGAAWHRGRPPLLRKVNHFLLQRSQLYVFCYARLKSFLYGSQILDINEVRGLNFVTLTPPSEYQNRAWRSSLEMLSQILAFCREHGYRTVVVIFPMQMQLSPMQLQFYRDKYHLRLGDETLSGEPQQRLREFIAAEGVAVVDLLPTYRTHSPEELYLRNSMIPADPSHPSVKGHQIAADEIFRALKQSLGDSISGRPKLQGAK
jgi:lysophospholipase L1-like esterase